MSINQKTADGVIIAKGLSLAIVPLIAIANFVYFPENEHLFGWIATICLSAIFIVIFRPQNNLQSKKVSVYEMQEGLKKAGIIHVEVFTTSLILRTIFDFYSIALTAITMVILHGATAYMMMKWTD